MPDQKTSKPDKIPSKGPKAVVTPEVAQRNRQAAADCRERARLAHPHRHVLDLGGGVIDVVPYGRFGARPRTMTLHGRVWEHVGEDSQGRWIYRP